MARLDWKTGKWIKNEREKKEREQLEEECKHKKRKRKPSSCEIFKCRKKAKYGFAMGEPLRCDRHADHKAMKTCVAVCQYPCPWGCKTIPKYGYPDGPVERCGSHKKKGMVPLNK